MLHKINGVLLSFSPSITRFPFLPPLFNYFALGFSVFLSLQLLNREVSFLFFLIFIGWMR
jgi:hypothetical protein